MATFVLIHGGGSSAWDWHLVAPRIEQAGHEVVAVDLPIEDSAMGLEEYSAAVTTAVGAHLDRVIVVGHSLGGFTAPLVAEDLRADGLVFFSAMIPAPGESMGEWWANTGHDRENVPDDENEAFFNGVADDLAQAARGHGRDQQGEWMSRPWPMVSLPGIPTGAILCLDDRFFPPEFMRRHIRERLGVEPVEIRGGHYAALSDPQAVADALVGFARDLDEDRGSGNRTSPSPSRLPPFSGTP